MTPLSDSSECYTPSGGDTVHVSTSASFIPIRGMVEVTLAETDAGLEVRLCVHGPVATTAVTLWPELAIELAESLIEHARRAGARYDPSRFVTLWRVRLLTSGVNPL